MTNTFGSKSARRSTISVDRNQRDVAVVSTADRRNWRLSLSQLRNPDTAWRLSSLTLTQSVRAVTDIFLYISFQISKEDAKRAAAGKVEHLWDLLWRMSRMKQDIDIHQTDYDFDTYLRRQANQIPDTLSRYQEPLGYVKTTNVSICFIIIIIIIIWLQCITHACTHRHRHSLTTNVVNQLVQSVTCCHCRSKTRSCPHPVTNTHTHTHTEREREREREKKNSTTCRWWQAMSRYSLVILSHAPSI